MRGLCVLISLLVTVTASSAALAADPPPSPAENIQRWTHATGATVYLVEKHDFPYVTFDITLRTGALWDPKDKPGLANFTAKMMARGAGQMGRAQIDTALDRLGADLDITTGQSGLSFEGDGLSRNLDEVAAILGDILQRPTFPESERQKLLRELESDILRVRDNDRRLNRRFFKRALYGAHPYGRPAEGTLAGLKAITKGDVEAFYKAHFVTGNLIFGFSGDITRAKADKLVDALAGRMARGEAPEIKTQDLPEIEGRRILLVDKPDRSQNQILLGHLAPGARSKDHYALLVANTIFGGTFTARLNHEVRDQRGLSYGAYSYVTSDKIAGSFSMWTFPASADGVKTVKLLIELFEGLLSTPLTEEEVSFAKRYLINAFAFDLDTPAKLVTEAIRAELEGRPGDYLTSYTDRIETVTTAEVNAAVKAHLDPKNFLLTMLCTAGGFEDAMRALPGVSSVKVAKYNRKF